MVGTKCTGNEVRLFAGPRAKARPLESAHRPTTRAGARKFRLGSIDGGLEKEKQRVPTTFGSDTSGHLTAIPNLSSDFFKNSTAILVARSYHGHFALWLV